MPKHGDRSTTVRDVMIRLGGSAFTFVVPAGTEVAYIGHGGGAMGGWAIASETETARLSQDKHGAKHYYAWIAEADVAPTNGGDAAPGNQSTS